MHVQDLYIYPVKSLGGIRVQSAEILQKGFRFDRRFMLINSDGQFLTQRTYPEMALLHTEIHNHLLHVFPVNDPADRVTLPLTGFSGDTIRVQVWDDVMDAVFTSENHARWFSKHLKTSARLVFFPEENARPVDPRFAGQNESVSFADGFPYLLISQESLNELNTRLMDPVPMNRFRPNIVISGAGAYAEDGWEKIFIGETGFRVSKPCARCVLITIDQQNAEKGKEPLATLSRYRRMGKKVLFGQNLIAENTGTIAVGDRIQILQTKNLPELDPEKVMR
ncbi:MAG: MOSC domain-containing protein [Mucilaginibacter polytrichastri]|nr:MOSC domain-containing protein [Mucilaginibacter polytrichastri]